MWEVQVMIDSVLSQLLTVQVHLRYVTALSRLHGPQARMTQVYVGLRRG